MGLFEKIFLKVGSKVVSFFTKNAEKKYPVYNALRQIGVSPTGNDFNVLYNETLYEFENNYVKHSLLVDLFKEESAKQAFAYDLRNNTQDRMLNDMHATIHSKEKYQDIYNAGIDLTEEISHFIELFAQKVQKARNPHDIDVINRLKSIEAIVKVSAETLDLSGHIQNIGKLRDENKHEAVKSLLLQYKNEKWQTLSSELKYKLSVHLGVTLFELGQKKDGARYFIELEQYQIKPAEALSLVALGHALLGNEAEAMQSADKALELDEKSVNAYLARLFVRDEQIRDPQEIDQLIPNAMQENPVIALNIATTLDRLGEREKAFAIYSRLEEDHQEMDSFRCDILTQLAANRVHSLTKKEDYYFDQLSDQSLEKLNLALGYYTTVWDYFKHTDLNKSRFYVPASRGVIYKALGKKELAEKDLITSLEFNKSYFAYAHLWELYSSKGENPDWIVSEVKTLELEPKQKQEVLLWNNTLRLQNGDTDLVLSELLAEIPKLNDAGLLKQYYSFIIDIFREKNQLADAEEYINELISLLPEDPMTYIIAWKVYRFQNHDQNSDSCLQKAIALTTEETANFTLWELANILLGEENYIAAAAVLRKGADTNLFSKFTHNLIISEFKSGNYKEAYSLADHLIQKYPDQPFLYDIKASVLEATQQFDAAEAVIQQYLIDNPGDAFFRVKLAMNLYKKSNYKAGVAELDKIEHYENIPIDYQFLIADAYIKGGIPSKGLEIAYQLRFEYYSDKAFHQRFLQLQAGIQDLKREHYFPEVVEKDCYVSMKDNFGKTHEYIVVQNPQHSLEIGIEESIGQELLGKHVGDTFSKGQLTYTITEIKWKYTYAMHDSMNQIQTRFDNEGPIRVFQLVEGENPLEMLKSILEPREENIITETDIDSQYKSRKVTIGFAANTSGISPVKYLGKLVHTPELGVFFNGTPDELATSVQLLCQTTPIILDLTALFTLHYSKAFSFLNSLPNQKYITQSTIDVLEAEVEEISRRLDTPDLHVNEVNGRFVRTIVSVEDKAKDIENLKAILGATNTYAKIIHPPLPSNFQEKEHRDRVLGQCFHDSLLIAQDLSGLLISDDAMFRQFAKSEYMLSGSPTIGLVQYLLTNDIITTTEVDNYYEQLVYRNYLFVPMHPKLLLKICQEGSYRISPAFMRACDCFTPMVVGDERAALFAAVFFKLLILNELASPSRDMVIQYVCGKLYEGRNASKMRSFLVGHIDIQFLLLPNQKAEVLRFIQLL